MKRRALQDSSAVAPFGGEGRPVPEFALFLLHVYDRAPLSHDASTLSSRQFPGRLRIDRPYRASQNTRNIVSTRHTKHSSTREEMSCWYEAVLSLEYPKNTFETIVDIALRTCMGECRSWGQSDEREDRELCKY